MSVEANTRAASNGVSGSWWAREPGEICQELGVDPGRGLAPDQVEANRQLHGTNQVEELGPTSLTQLLFESVKSPMMVLLLTIAAISLAVGQLREAVVMVFVVAMYVAVHLLNKARADRTMANLRKVQAPKTFVLRDGKRTEIPDEEVVVGDILPLQSGSRVPADARLVSSAGLFLSEAALTGESAPAEKQADAEVSADAPLAERPTAVFAGTTVLDGQGTAVVVAVGRESELGRVARLSMQPREEPTPLQREMSGLARTLAFAAVAVSLVIPLVGLLRGFGFQEMVQTWLSLTFLMVPGQPPIIIAMALALASLESARRQVIVRRLQGAETLGSVDVILSDKTGTMTENRMELSGVLLPGAGVRAIDQELRDGQDDRLREFFNAALLTIPADAGTPTDLAILGAADRLHFARPRAGQLVNLSGFTRGRFRALEYRQNGSSRFYFTGPADYLIDRSDRRLSAAGGASRTEAWSETEREDLKRESEEQARQGKRVTAYAFREGGSVEGEPQGLTFAGVALISDPIRPEVKDAVRQLKEAGIRTVMVTGDARETAIFVGQEVGVGGEALSGQELERLSPEQMQEAVRSTSVYYRSSPEQKLKLVQAFQHLGQTVAVTGDGINDAPALSTAHIGIAMGERGTDAAKEAADLVLTDDDFSHLPGGVAIGRKAYDNFRKGITYYLSAKAILLAIFIVPLIVGEPFPLAPIQIIFTELLMDLASSTIFVTEAAEPDVMRRRPRPRGPFLSWGVARRIGRNMAGLTVAILVVYFGSLALDYGTDSARTAAFATWLLGHIVLALNLKQESTPLLKQGLLSNRFAAGWLVGMCVLVLAMTLVPFARDTLQTTSLGATQWSMVVASAVLASGWIEAAKWLGSSANPGSP